MIGSILGTTSADYRLPISEKKRRKAGEQAITDTPALYRNLITYSAAVLWRVPGSL